MADDLEDDVNEEDIEAGEEGEDGEEEQGGNKKVLIIVIALLVLLLGAGAGLYFTGMLDGLLGKSEATEEEHSDDHEDGHAEDGKKKKGKGDDHGDDYGEKGGSTAFIEIPKMVINLNTDGDVPRYLRLSVQLELQDAADTAAVEAVIPRVVDQFQTYLRELRVRDLRGSGGIYRLQTELLWRVNQAAAPVEVKDVLFQEILIQ